MLQELEGMKSEIESTSGGLEVKLKKFLEERESELDKLEFEKLRLLDMERQDRSVPHLCSQTFDCQQFSLVIP